MKDHAYVPVFHPEQRYQTAHWLQFQYPHLATTAILFVMIPIYVIPPLHE